MLLMNIGFISSIRVENIIATHEINMFSQFTREIKAIFNKIKKKRKTFEFSSYYTSISATFKVCITSSVLWQRTQTEENKKDNFRPPHFVF